MYNLLTRNTRAKEEMSNVDVTIRPETPPYTYIIRSKTVVIAAKCHTATNSKTL